MSVFGTLYFSIHTGAARGYFDQERKARTKEFIQRLEKSIRFFAWLNPMPIVRWEYTTAAEIARMIPMFEMSRPGLNSAINILRGRSFPGGWLHG